MSKAVTEGETWNRLMGYLSRDKGMRGSWRGSSGELRRVMSTVSIGL